MSTERHAPPSPRSRHGSRIQNDVGGGSPGAVGRPGAATFGPSLAGLATPSRLHGVEPEPTRGLKAAVQILRTFRTVTAVLLCRCCGRRRRGQDGAGAAPDVPSQVSPGGHGHSAGPPGPGSVQGSTAGTLTCLAHLARCSGQRGGRAGFRL